MSVESSGRFGPEFTSLFSDASVKHMDNEPTTRRGHQIDSRRALRLGAFGVMALAAVIAALPNASAQAVPSSPTGLEDKGCDLDSYEFGDNSQGVTLGWTHSGPAPTGFKIYHAKPASQQYVQFATTSNNWFHYEPPYQPAGGYNYYVTAYSSSGESAPSNAINVLPCDLNYPTGSGGGATFGWTKVNPTLNTFTWEDYSGLVGASYGTCASPSMDDCYCDGAPVTPVCSKSMPTQPAGATTWTPSWQLPEIHQGYNYVFLGIEDREGLKGLTQGRHGIAAADAYLVKYDSLPPAVSNTVDLGWVNVWPTLGTTTWTDPHSGLQNNFQYADGSTAASQAAAAYYPLPVQPSPGQTTPFTPSWTPAGSSQGMHHIQVRSSDMLGTAGTVEAYTFGYDTVAPTATNIASATHPDQAAFYQATSFTAGLAAADTLAGVDGFYTYVTTAASCPSDLSAVGTFHDANADSAAYVTEVGLGPFGEYLFCAQARDNAGNLGTVRDYQVNVNTIAPTISAYGPTGVTSNANTPVFGYYNANKGGLDPAQKTRVDPGAVHLTIDGSIDVVAFWMATPICAPIWTSACPVTVDSDHAEYRPVAPWTNGVHSVLLNIGDTTLPAVTASQAWTFTVAAAAQCPSGTTGTVIQGIPVCVAIESCPAGTIGLVIEAQQVCVPIPPNPCPTPISTPGPGELTKVCGIGVPNALPGDQDADNVPDNQEAALCSQENPNILSDGHCTGSDYTLPTWSDVVSDVIWLATGTRP